MQLRPNARFIERTLNIHSNYGGLGDHLSRLTAIKFIKEEHPHVRMTVYWHDYFVPLAKVLVPETEMLRHKSKTEMALADDTIPLIDFKPEYITSLSMGLVEHAFAVIAQRSPREQDFIYPRYSPETKTGLFKDYVVITPCFTSKTREWKGEEINKLIHEIHALGLKTMLMGEMSNIPLGNGKSNHSRLPEGFDRSLATIDMIGQTSLVECLDMLSEVKCVVGVDNGLLHLTACTDTPTVWGFTSVLTEHRLPKGVKALAVTAEPGCYGCQSKCYLVKHDFTKCMFGDYLCINEMTSVKFLQQLKKILDLS